MSVDGCFDRSCVLRDNRGGMCTNGGCHCLDSVEPALRRAIRRRIQTLRTERNAAVKVRLVECYACGAENAAHAPK